MQIELSRCFQNLKQLLNFNKTCFNKQMHLQRVPSRKYKDPFPSAW